MIFMPPGHAKTEFVSRMLPAFVFGRNPDARIIACSHTADFTGLLNREVQRIMEEERYRRLFADSRLNDRAVKASSFGQYRRTTDYFEIVGHHGFYRSTGVGGTLHGIRFDLGIIDDPIKSWEYANSPTCRQKLWEWYASDFSSRQWTNAAIVLMHTRFHRDDLAGRLLRKMLDRREEQWEVLSLPAIRTATQTHPEDLRQVGEPLWTAFKDYDALERERHKDSKAFAALYQQDPSEAGMNEWAPEYFARDIWCKDADWPAHFEVSGIGVDPSKGAKDKQGDYCGIVFVGRYNGVFYINANGERRNAKDIVRAVRQFADAHKPDAVGFETDQFQQLIADQMQADAPDMLKQWKVLQMPTGGKPKRVRILRLSPYITQRRFKFRETPGCRLLVDQLMDFPTADHDDLPDALEQCLRVVYHLLGIGTE
jgi:predicted phage terminase large subunit-like protein